MKEAIAYTYQGQKIYISGEKERISHRSDHT